MVALIEEELRDVQDGVDYFEVDIFFVNDGCQQILDEVTKNLQSLKTNDFFRRANHLERVSQLHAYLLLMKSHNDLTELLWIRNNLIFGHFGFSLKILVVYDVLNYVEKLKTFVFVFTEFLNFLIGEGFEFCGLFS